MSLFFPTKQSSFPKRLFCGLTAFFFLSTSIFPTASMAQALPQTILNLPVPGSVVAPTTGFTPAMIKGVNLYPDNPLKFDFIIDKGDAAFTDEEFKKESTRLIKYFLSSLTVPEDEMWVNLSPYEKNRIVPQDFGKTEMGRDLLAQDYMLKQLTASLMNPDDKLGGEFWQRVYAKAQEKYGTTDIPMNTFNKIWIVPEKAVVYEHEKGAFVVKSHLKVLMEEDYLALHQNGLQSTVYSLQQDLPAVDGRLSTVNLKSEKIISGLQSKIVKDLLIPEIEKEVNEGQTFTNLRQIYNAVILASWYKQALNESLLGQVYIDQKKTKGVETDDKTVNEQIYNQYVESFKKGVYNYIKEDYNPDTQEVVNRKYFSGGIKMMSADLASLAVEHELADSATLAKFPHNVTVDLSSFEKQFRAPLLDRDKLLADELKFLFKLFGEIDLEFVSPDVLSHDGVIEKVLDEQGRLKKILFSNRFTAENLIDLLGSLLILNPDGQKRWQQVPIRLRAYLQGWKKVLAEHSTRPEISEKAKYELASIERFFGGLVKKIDGVFDLPVDTALDSEIKVEDGIRGFIERTLEHIKKVDASKQQRLADRIEFFF